MVQRDVLRVCEENIHIPHCLLLCNAVYYCGSMFSTNTIPLRKDSEDEGTVGEDFLLRGQGISFFTLLIRAIDYFIFYLQSNRLFPVNYTKN